MTLLKLKAESPWIRSHFSMDGSVGLNKLYFTFRINPTGESDDDGDKSEDDDVDAGRAKGDGGGAYKAIPSCIPPHLIC